MGHLLGCDRFVLVGHVGVWPMPVRAIAWWA